MFFSYTDRKMKAAKAAFDSSIDNGITFFDTAEVYGSRVRSLIRYVTRFSDERKEINEIFLLFFCAVFVWCH